MIFQETQRSKVKELSRLRLPRTHNRTIIIGYSQFDSTFIDNVKVVLRVDFVVLLKGRNGAVCRDGLLKHALRESSRSIKHSPQGLLIFGQLDGTLVSEQAYDRSHVYVQVEHGPNDAVQLEFWSFRGQKWPHGPADDAIEKQKDVGSNET